MMETGTVEAGGMAEAGMMEAGTIGTTTNTNIITTITIAINTTVIGIEGKNCLTNKVLLYNQADFIFFRRFSISKIIEDTNQGKFY